MKKTLKKHCSALRQDEFHTHCISYDTKYHIYYFLTNLITYGYNEVTASIIKASFKGDGC